MQRKKSSHKIPSKTRIKRQQAIIILISTMAIPMYLDVIHDEQASRPHIEEVDEEYNDFEVTGVEVSHDDDVIISAYFNDDGDDSSINSDLSDYELSFPRSQRVTRRRERRPSPERLEQLRQHLDRRQLLEVRTSSIGGGEHSGDEDSVILTRERLSPERRTTTGDRIRRGDGSERGRVVAIARSVFSAIRSLTSGFLRTQYINTSLKSIER
jgi:hypothetical protein